MNGDAPKLIICPCLCGSNNNEDGACIRDFVVLDPLVTNKDLEHPFSLDNHMGCRYYTMRVRTDD